MYLGALTDLTLWFFALDHTNYARWIPVHLKDIVELPTKYRDCQTVQWWSFHYLEDQQSVLYYPYIDQAHE